MHATIMSPNYHILSSCHKIKEILNIVKTSTYIYIHIHLFLYVPTPPSYCPSATTLPVLFLGPTSKYMSSFKQLWWFMEVNIQLADMIDMCALGVP